MTAIVGDPESLRALALTLGASGAVDLTAVDALARAGVALSAGYRSSTGGTALVSAIGAPCGSLDGAGRLLQSAVPLLTGYADELELQQSVAAAAALDLTRVEAGRARLQQERAIPSLAWLGSDPDVRAESLERQEQAATAARRSSVTAAGDAASALVLSLSTLAAQLELLAVPTVRAAAGPAAVPGFTAIGQVPTTRTAGVGQWAVLSPMPAGSPTARRQWWDRLSPAAQAGWIAARPAEIGRAAGLPAAVRDLANRALVTRDESELRARLMTLGLMIPADPTDDEGAALADRLQELGWSQADALAAVGTLATTRELRRAESETDQAVQLLIYEPSAFDGNGRAAIAIGNLDTAQNVGVLVPGMTSDVPSYLDNHTGNALSLSGAAQTADVDAAVLAYIGYRAPGFDTSVASTDLAHAGAEYLTADLAALRAGRTASPARVTVVAHSYGSVTASIAFDRYGAQADALVLAQSPGAGTATSVLDYEGVPAHEVYVIADSTDLVGWLGRLLVSPLGVDPSGLLFGAQRLHNETSGASNPHSQLYQQRWSGQANVVSVLAGRPDQLNRAIPRITYQDLVFGFDVTVDLEMFRWPEIPGQPVLPGG